MQRPLLPEVKSYIMRSFVHVCHVQRHPIEPRELTTFLAPAKEMVRTQVLRSFMVLCDVIKHNSTPTVTPQHCFMFQACEQGDTLAKQTLWSCCLCSLSFHEAHVNQCLRWICTLLHNAHVDEARTIYNASKSKFSPAAGVWLVDVLLKPASASNVVQAPSNSTVAVKRLLHEIVLGRIEGSHIFATAISLSWLL